MKTKKISADEARAKRKDQTRDTDRGSAVVKASKAPASWDKEARSARFVMSTQQTDRYGDIVVTDGIDTEEFERNPVGLLFHKGSQWPVAKWGNLEKQVRGRPPRLEGDFILLPAGGPIAEIEQAEWMLANDGIRACSIGFLPDWDAIEMILDDEGKPTWGCKFNSSELLECSVCAIPANAGALIKGADGDHRLAKELLEDVLDNWRKSPEGLLMSREDYEKAYRMTVEKIGAPAAKPAAADEGAVDEEILKFLLKGETGDVLRIDGEAEGTFLVLEREEALVDQLPVPAITDAERALVTARAAELAAPADTAKLIGKAVTGEGLAPVTMPIKIEFDSAEFERDASRVTGLLDGIAEKIASIFKRNKTERVEPVVDTPLPPEAVAAAKAKVAAVRERAIKKIAA